MQPLNVAESQGSSLACGSTDVLVVGNYCHDRIILLDGETLTMGGSVAYASAVFRAAKEVPYRVIATVGDDWRYGNSIIAPAFEAPRQVAQTRTTSFVDNFTIPGQADRSETLEAPGEPIRPQDLGDVRVHYGMAVGVANEILPETLQRLRDLADVLLVDAQGLLRTVTPENHVVLRPLTETPYSKSLLQSFDYLKVSQTEAPFVNIEELRQHVTILLTDGPRGCEIITAAAKEHVEAPPAPELDPTGAGDSFLAGFTVGLQRGLSVRDAVRLGNACGAVAVTQKGVSTFPDGMFPKADRP